MCVGETCPPLSKKNNIYPPFLPVLYKTPSTVLDRTISKKSTTNCWRMWLHCFDLPLRGMLEENEWYSFEADPQKRKQRLMYDLMDKTANRVWCCLESTMTLPFSEISGGTCDVFCRQSLGKKVQLISLIYTVFYASFTDSCMYLIPFHRLVFIHLILLLSTIILILGKKSRLLEMCHKPNNIETHNKIENPRKTHTQIDVTPSIDSEEESLQCTYQHSRKWIPRIDGSNTINTVAECNGP